MGSTLAIPATMPVEFTERLVYLLGELGMMRPHLGAVVAFGGRLDESRLRRALRLLLDAEPVLGCRFVPDQVPPTWRRLEAIDAEALLSVIDSTDAVSAANSFVAEPFDSSRGPQLLGALFRASDADVLAIKMTHVAVDGGALKEAVYLLAEIYRALAVDCEWTPQPNVDGIRGPLAKAGFFERLAALRQGNVLTPPSDWGVTDLVSDKPATYLMATLGPGMFREAIALAKSHGATVNDLILTAYYRVLYRVFDSTEGDRTPLQVSCELRKHLPSQTKTALANISSAWSISVAPRHDESFIETLDRVVASTSAWKRSGAGKAQAIAMPMVNRLMRRQGLDPLRKQMAKGFDSAGDDRGYPTLTNVGVIDEGRLDFGLPVSDAWLLGPVGSAIVLTASTYRGTLHLAIGAEKSVIEKQSIGSVAADTIGEITAWVGRKAGVSAELLSS